MRIINLCQRSPEWLAWRAQGVSASQAAAILGRSPFQTAWNLWAVRVGLLPEPDLSNNFFVQRGVQFEDQARQGYESRHDELVLPACAEHGGHPVLRASFDGINSAGEPVELKVPWQQVYQKVLAEKERSAAYQYYWVQVQFQMAVADSASGWLVFDPCHASAGAIDFQIPRDQAFIESELIPRCLEFWELLVQKKEPAKDPARDFFVPEGAQAVAWGNLAQRYRHLDHQQARLAKMAKRVAEEMKTVQGGLVEMMGDWVLAEQDGIKVTRYRQSSVNSAGMLAELVPEIPAEVRARHTKTDWRVRLTVAKARDKTALTPSAEKPRRTRKLRAA
ncbi:MAG: endonuclease [Chromatiaceae bacterium]|nr:MAG: endonuclease [Chromatiaceae bacterium]